MFIPARNPPYASAIKNNDQIKSICAILLYRFLNIIVTSTTNTVQYPTNINNVLLPITFVSARFFWPMYPSR